MKPYHQEASRGRWQKFNTPCQMANIGSDVIRAINWRDKDAERAHLAFERSLELIHLTIDDAKNKKRLRELTRLRELWTDYFAGNNDYRSTEKQFVDYFMAFNYAARAST